MNVLIFPASIRDGLVYAEAARRQGDFVLGAAAVPVDDLDRKRFSAWEHLPFVTEPGFPEAFERLVRQYEIEAIYSPHTVVWSALHELLPALTPGVSLLNENPMEQVLAPLREAEARRASLPFTQPGLIPESGQMPGWLQTTLILALQHLPGQCTEEKLILMASLVYGGVRGDVVEIGSLWGRSAYALAMPAALAAVGPVLCVDPWQAQAYEQPDSSAILASATSLLDPEASYRFFLSNLAPFAGAHCNYIRGYSTTAAETYRNSREIRSECFGVTRYSGRISLLHIDGNHDYQAVVEDLEAWTPLLLPGAWIVLDDYCWPFGDGPRLAGDEWLARHADRIDIAFGVSSCLWIHLKA